MLHHPRNYEDDFFMWYRLSMTLSLMIALLKYL